MPLDVTYEAGIACVLYDKKGAVKTTQTDKSAYPYITQDGEDREDRPGQYVANIHDGTVIGYKYFDLTDADSISVTVRGQAEGKLIVLDTPDGSAIAQLHITFSTQDLWAKLNAHKGISALYFCYQGVGQFDLIDFRIVSRIKQ